MKRLSMVDNESFEIFGDGWILGFIILALILLCCFTITAFVPKAHLDNVAVAEMQEKYPVFAIALGICGFRIFLHFLNEKLFVSKFEYQERIKNGCPNAVTIPFSLFEGGYSRNPSAWELCDKCVKRGDEVCVFSFKDYKKYRKFRASINEEAERVQMEKERLTVKEERKLFEQDPEAYLSSKGGKEFDFEYETPAKEFSELQNDIQRYKQQRVIADVLDDYQNERGVR